MVAPTPNSPAPTRGLDPRALFAIRDLELRARVVVEGLWAGLQRSPYTGFSAEFTEYRQYTVGDDLRHLDWRVVARTDRHYLKQFEDETNLRCQLLVDVSRSMEFGSTGVSKSQYARTLAATLGYFLLKQRDAVGLATFADGLLDVLPARWRRGQWRHLLALLERTSPARDTRLDRALDHAAPLWRRRSVVVIISDFLSPVSEWDRALGRVAAAGHDVRAIQVLDPAEQTLNFGRAAVWEDIENGQTLYVDPDRARGGYLERFSAHQSAVRLALQQRGIPHIGATLDRPLDLVLNDLIRGSGAARRLRRRR